MEEVENTRVVLCSFCLFVCLFVVSCFSLLPAVVSLCRSITLLPTYISNVEYFSHTFGCSSSSTAVRYGVPPHLALRCHYAAANHATRPLATGEPQFWRQRAWPPVREFLAGSFAGVGLIAAGHPFDTIKVGTSRERGERERETESYRLCRSNRHSELP
jgi:hypothetical protein